MAKSGFDTSRQQFGYKSGSLDSSRNQSRTPSRNASFDSRIIYGDDSTGMESGGLNIKSNVNILPLDLSASWTPGDERQQYLTPSREDSLDELGRRRKTSISFDPEARLDDGARHALDQPLPRTGSLRSVATADRPNSARRAGSSVALPMQFDAATCKINPFTGEPVRRRPRRQDTASSGISVLDMFNRPPPPPAVPGEGQYASLTSGSTASPPHDELQTPTSPDEIYPVSPTGASSPAFSPTLESEPWPAFRTGSVRSLRTLPSRPISLRRESRRESKRSASSSFSPASAFLSKWGRESMNAAAPDPDEEGQAFGPENEYIIGRQIGYGGFSAVKEAYTITADGEKRKHAVKIVRKNIRDKPEPDNEKCQQGLEHEVGIWKYLSHHHILSLITVFDTDFATFCVMDLVDNGSLYDLVRDSRKAGATKISPALAKSYSYQLAAALRYLHEDVRIVHRDIKMENCLIEKDPRAPEDAPGTIRLCDFGLADFISSESPDMSLLSQEAQQTGDAANVVGTLDYAAPEVFHTDRVILQPSVDIWAYAVCVFTLVTGDRPFKHSLAPKLLELITSAVWDEDAVRNAPAAEGYVDEILDLLRGCLNPDVASRWTITKVLSSPWFADCDDSHAH